jgi:hypothetical protein
MRSYKRFPLLVAASLFSACAIAQVTPDTQAQRIDVAAAPAASTDSRQPAVDSATPQRPVHGTLRGVLAAAEQGPDSLRRYVYITRGIYNYRFQDFAKSEWYER